MVFASIIALAAALAADAPPPIAPAERARFETALASDDWDAAGEILNRWIEVAALTRGSDDALLRDAIGRFELHRGGIDWAVAYLTSVPPTALSGDAAVRHQLAQAEALKLAGEPDAAAAAYRAVSAGARPAGGLEAQLGLAETLLATDPAESLTIVAALQPLPDDRGTIWRAARLKAVALSLLGRTDEARAVADRAWPLAASLPPADNAVRETAAILAAVASDRATIAAMTDLAQTGAPDGSIETLSKQMLPLLPACGEAGIGAEDFVQLIIGRAANGWSTALTPVRASRPGAVRAFIQGIAGSNLLNSDERGRGVFSVTLRCQHSPRPPRAMLQGGARIASWAVRNRLYFPIALGPPADADELRRREERLAEREEKLGQDNVLLLPTLLMSSEAVAARAASAGDIPLTRAAQLAARAAGLARKIEGGSGLFPPSSSADFSLKLAEEAPGSDAARQRLWQEAVKRWFAEVDPAAVYRSVQAIAADEDMPVEAKLDLLSDAVSGLNGRTGAKDEGIGYLRALHASYLFGQGREAEARREVSESGAPADLCRLREKPPRVEVASVTSDDYPKEALSAFLEGRDVLEFDVDARGAIVRMRPIFEAPARVFSGIALGKMAAFRMKPGEDRGRPVACRAMVQTIRWAFPGNPMTESGTPAPRLPPGT